MGHLIVCLQVALHLAQENGKACLLGTVSGTLGTHRQPVECGGISGLRLGWEFLSYREQTSEGSDLWKKSRVSASS